ncbi:MAG: thiamine diphosphokinase [Acidimicrobiales bacterium]|nr:MAG: thiamine diphosphokinase [Acidimicrobiales bacterium]
MQVQRTHSSGVVVDPKPPVITVVVVAGGDPPSLADLNDVPANAIVVGADRGVAYARELGLKVAVAVGDFDSIPADALDAAAAAGASIRRYPAEKDATDLELALDAALEFQPRRVVLLGAYGGRPDHELANLLLVAAPRYARLNIQARHAGATCTVIHRSAELHGAVGELVSLLPVHGPAMGVETAGLRYQLRGEALEPGSSRGVSNEFAEPQAQVRLRSGVLLAIQPHSPK